MNRSSKRIALPLGKRMQYFILHDNLEGSMDLKRTTAALVAAGSMLAGTAAFADNMGQMGTGQMGHMKMGRDMGRDTMMHGMMMGRFGGPVYNGPPALAVTASLVSAGGGPSNYSTATALTSMVGKNLVNGEVKKLSKQYGASATTMWLKTFDFAVHDSLKIATAAGVKLPAPAMSGKKLAASLVSAGTWSKDGTFQIEYLLDKAVTHKIHVQVMNDIDREPGLGKKADLDYHRISNQAFYDLAQALGATSVKLAPIH
ncbi:MAG: hypothetical protein DLM53_06850 [Candidatus Eremiobacter antarcticus]|nr:MAG: hypothetical protein DLM53_06850 [Candidatus Eremiobacter sp. RRmetagenome_bin22]